MKKKMNDAKDIKKKVTEIILITFGPKTEDMTHRTSCSCLNPTF